jgi:NDP-sugar pyrophosphorylase family protein
MKRRGRELLESATAARLVRRTTAALVPPPPGAFAAFGSGSIILPPCRIEGATFMSLGTDVLIHEHVWLLARSMDGGPHPSLVLGDQVMLNRFVKIVVCSSVVIGEGTVAGDRLYVSDVEYEPGHASIHPAERPLTEPRPVRIGANVHLGVGVVVKPGVTIGDRAYIGAGSIVEDDVPARAVAAGAPARVLKTF